MARDFTVFVRVVEHILDRSVGVAVDEDGVRVVRVELIDERSQPLVEEPHDPIHPIDALLRWGHIGDPQAGDAAKWPHPSQEELPQSNTAQGLNRKH